MRIVLLALLSLPFFLSLFQPGLATAQAILVASVNGTGIPQERLELAFEEDLRQRKMHLLQIRNPERMKSMRRDVLDNLIEQELFWQEAQKAGMVATPDELAAAYEATKKQFKSAASFEQRILVEGYTPESYRELVQRQVSAGKYATSVAAKAPAVTDEDVHRFYVDNPERFSRPEQVRARHIVINVPKGATEAQRAEKRALMEQILKDARAGEAFDNLARLHSEAPTKQWGGEMDPFSRGQVAKPLEEAAFSLAPGQVSEVLSLPEGVQILKVESRTEAITIGEEQAREKVRNYLQELRGTQAVKKEGARLRAAGDVKILLPM
jgi:parvulin-like peptidyl-prolyl isomerase